MLRLSAALFCTGFTTALCLLAWQRMLAPLSGTLAVPATLVTVAFLAGLGLGGLLAARFADRLSPETGVRAAAVAAAITAVYTFFSKLVLYDILVQALSGLGGGAAAVFLLAFLALLPPALLTGAILPLAGRAAVSTLGMVADRVGWLLSLLGLGAGLAALAGGWLLFGLLGFSGAVAVAVPLQLLAAILALTLAGKRRYWSRKRRDQRIRERLARAGQPRGAPVPAEPLPHGAGIGRFGLWCGFSIVSAFAATTLLLASERVLGQLGEFHAYLRPSLLGLFLLALGGGIGMGVRRLETFRGDPRAAFLAGHAMGLTLAVAMLLALWWALPLGPMRLLLPDLPRLRGEAFDLMLLLTLLLAVPPGYLIGRSLPLLPRAVLTDAGRIGSRIGLVQGCALLGLALGLLGSGLLAFELVGTAGTLRLLAALALLAALGWLRWAAPGLRAALRDTGAGALRGRLAPMAVALGAAALLVLLPGNTGFWARMHGVAPGGRFLLVEGRDGVAFWRDDTLRREGETIEGPLFLAGQPRAAIPFRLPDLALGAAGPLMHPSPRRVLVLGPGSGGALRAAAALPGVQSVRAVEGFPPALELLRRHAALRPEGPVATLLARPGLVIETGDLRRALVRSAPRSFEVIVLDPGPAWTAQAGLLQSRQFFELVRSRLVPDGILVLAAPSWTVVQTMTTVFPFAVMYRPADIVIASQDPLPSPRPRLLTRLGTGAVAQALVGPDREEALALIRQVSGETLLWLPSTPRIDEPLSDMLPREEFFLHHPVRETRGMEMPADIRADRARR